jgi:DNA-binding transcriptional MerR regulator
MKEVPVDRVVIQEKIIETIREVPVEVIKEIIKEVEVPVEVIKEIIIEKESDGNWKPKLDALQNTVHKLKQDNIEKDKKIKEYEQTIQDIQKFQENKKAVYLSGSNLNKIL